LSYSSMMSRSLIHNRTPSFTLTEKVYNSLNAGRTNPVQRIEI